MKKSKTKSQIMKQKKQQQYIEQGIRDGEAKRRKEMSEKRGEKKSTAVKAN